MINGNGGKNPRVTKERYNGGRRARIGLIRTWRRITILEKRHGLRICSVVIECTLAEELGMSGGKIIGGCNIKA